MDKSYNIELRLTYKATVGIKAESEADAVDMALKCGLASTCVGPFDPTGFINVVVEGMTEVDEISRPKSPTDGIGKKARRDKPVAAQPS